MTDKKETTQIDSGSKDKENADKTAAVEEVKKPDDKFFGKYINTYY